MHVGVKYCGGCNPFYDRGFELQKLEESLNDISFEPVQRGEKYEAVLLICGCPRACIRNFRISVDGKEAPGYLLVKSREDFAAAQGALRDYGKNQSKNETA